MRKLVLAMLLGTLSGCAAIGTTITDPVVKRTYTDPSPIRGMTASSIPGHVWVRLSPETIVRVHAAEQTGLSSSWIMPGKPAIVIEKRRKSGKVERFLCSNAHEDACAAITTPR